MKKFILCVDDEEKILVALERELEDWLEDQGYMFRGASSVDEALSLLEQDVAFCVAVVSDLKMPYKKGSELLLEISRRWPTLGTILLTGFSDMDEIKDCIKAGIVSFLQKPWNREILKAEISRVIELTSIREEHVIYFNRLKEDFFWTRTLHHELLLQQKMPVTWLNTSLGYRAASGTIDCGGDMFFSFAGPVDTVFLCFGSLSVTGVEGTYHSLRIRDLIHSIQRKLLPSHGPDYILEQLNTMLVSSYQNLPENSFSLSVFCFQQNVDAFVSSHGGGEHFVIVDNADTTVHVLPSPVLGMRENLRFPMKKYAFNKSSKLILFSRSIYEDPLLRPLFTLEQESLMASVNSGENEKRTGSSNFAQKLLDVLISKDSPKTYDAVLGIVSLTADGK